MTNFLKKIFPEPTLEDIHPTHSPVSFSLNHLRTGVDNVRYDVFLSTAFSESARLSIRLLIARCAEAEDMLPLNDANASFSGTQNRFRELCQELFLNALHRSRTEDVQIDILAQAAVIRLMLDLIHSQFDYLLDQFKLAIREAESINNQEQAMLLKQRMAVVMENRNHLNRKAGKEIFQSLPESQVENADEIRRISFGRAAVIPGRILPNPMLYAGNPDDDMFILDEYEILLGHRADDPDRYTNILAILSDCLLKMATNETNANESIADESDAKSNNRPDNPPDADTVSRWLLNEENIDSLFNCFQLGSKRRSLWRRGKTPKSDIEKIQRKAFQRRQRMKAIYSAFRKAGVMKRIVGAYEMQPLYRDYCPPLAPQLVLQFLTSFRDKQGVIGRIKRFRRLYGKNLALGPLSHKRKKLWLLNRRTQQAYLIRFLKDFSRYHRDRFNYEQIKAAIDQVHLVTDKKILQLSRTNNCLYEFLLSDESASVERPIQRHVVLKADVRGSTDITHKMLSENLNPASYFSLNFFDPISDILPEYGASKVFVEGDAIILTIFERNETPEGGYSVARACGLATRILSIVRRCNRKNRKHGLPAIELGIGISYRDGAPTFLFDGDHRIMISSAINLADRLSGCSKPLRKKLEGNPSPFNLFVFKGITEELSSKSADDFSLRYNVNGIELNADGFEKLKQEIDLKSVVLKLNAGSVRMYTGKYPLVDGGYYRLVIRAAKIRKIDPESLAITEKTRKIFYEVCTDRTILANVRKYIRQRM